MRDFSFVKTDQPSMAEFNKRFGGIADFANNLGNEYVWEKTRQETVYAPNYSQTGENVTFLRASTSSEKATMTYAYKIDANMNLVNAKTVEFSYDNCSHLSALLKNAFWYNSDNSKLFYFPAAPVVAATYISSSGKYAVYVDAGGAARAVSSVYGTSVRTVYGYINSPDPNAYPIDDGYTYTALGQLGAKVQIATGSYTGTGVGGTNNPNSLTFDFVPKFIFVQANTTVKASMGTGFFVWGQQGGKFYIYGSNGGLLVCAFSDKTMTWYVPESTDANMQLNSASVVFDYIAIG